MVKELQVTTGLRVYVAGPMRGVPMLNFPAFDRARDRLRAMGHLPVSPADIDREAGFDPLDLPADHDWSVIPPTLELREIVARDLAALTQCDAIAMLDGWETSKGAQAELAVARWMGLPEVKL